MPWYTKSTTIRNRSLCAWNDASAEYLPNYATRPEYLINYATKQERDDYLPDYARSSYMEKEGSHEHR
jgi:hypothetical protein